MTLAVFWVLVYALCFWAADSKFLGHEDPKESILQFRPWLVKRSAFFRKLLSCYFCVGSWMGPVAHVICYSWFGSAYALYHPSTVWWWIGGTVLASLLGAVGAYVIDSVISYLERDPWAS